MQTFYSGILLSQSVINQSHQIINVVQFVFKVKWQAGQGEDYCIECSIVNPITNILFKLYCYLQWSAQGSSMFCILCLGQLFVYYCTFRQYLFPSQP